MKRGILFFAAAVILVLVWWLWPTQPLTVSTHEVAKGEVLATVVNTRAGTIKACSRSFLALPVGGVVQQLWVTEGDRVKQGQPLLSLWNEDIRARMQQAQSELESTTLEKARSCLQAEHDRREASRLQQLAKQNLASETEVDNAATLANTSELACRAAEVNQATALANVNLSRAQLSQTQLVAPFAGIVAEVNGELGEYLTPSPPAVPTPPAIDLIDDQCLYVSAPIDEVDAHQVQLDQTAWITLDALGDQRLPARISRIAPYVVEVEKQARTVEVEARFDDPGQLPRLLVGYSADIEILVDQRQQVIRIPADALTEDQRIWVVTDQHARQRVIETGLSNWNWVEITAGVNTGEQIIRQPGRWALSDGLEVAVEEQLE